MRRSFFVLGSMVAGVALATAQAFAQDHQLHGDAARVGTVTFENSCSADVQPAFGRGIALLHSFEFGPAIKAFQMAAAGDPSCGIASWGIALAQWSNPFAVAIRSPEQLQTGRATVERASMAGAKTERERHFIAAIATLYAAPVSTDQRVRVAPEYQQEDRGQHAQDQDPIRKCEPVALVHELARQKLVARED